MTGSDDWNIYVWKVPEDRETVGKKFPVNSLIQLTFFYTFNGTKNCVQFLSKVEQMYYMTMLKYCIHSANFSQDKL